MGLPSLLSPPSSPSPTAYKFVKPDFDEDEDKEAAVSDTERLSVFYANATYDSYGIPSSAQCIYKNGDAWPVCTGPESQRIIREARSVYGHPTQVTWRELGECVHTLLDNKEVCWTVGKMTFCLLLIWIGVKPKSLAYELANTVAEAVTFLLTEAGFSGFEVTRSVDGPKMLSFNKCPTSPHPTGPNKVM